MKPYGFWISPTNEVFTIMNDFGHKQFIEKVLEKTFNSDEDATQQTLDLGWIRIVNGSSSLMIDYRYIQTKEQLKLLKELKNKLEENGYFHKDYILSYGYDYWNFDTFDKLINHIKNRSC